MNLFREAERYLPGGVNSPVRAFRAVGGEPVFIKRGRGAYVWDESGKRYLDFCASWGPLLFGHAPPALVRRLCREIVKGTSFGTVTRKEVELARSLRQFFPSLEKVRLVSSGTEAVLSALRLARGFTGREKIVKMDGCYHGHADSLLVKAGSGVTTFGLPDSDGVPKALAQLTLSIPFNDFQALDQVFREQGNEIAALILEPVPANMGVVLPRPGYLEACRLLTQKHGALLIFDEVITGLRIARGGAQEYFKIVPDLTCLGKILGGGLPLAAFGGRQEVMSRLAPEGPVYQAGTLSGNPVAVTAALWVLEELRKAKGDSFYKALNQKAEDFFGALQKIIKRCGLPVRLNACGSLFTLFFTPEVVTDYASARSSDTNRFARFFHRCLRQGVYLAPSQFEADFISAAHTSAHLKRALNVFKRALIAVYEEPRTLAVPSDRNRPPKVKPVVHRRV